MAQNTGLFALGVQIEGIASEISKLDKLSSAINRVSKEAKGLSKYSLSTAFKLAFGSDYEKGFKQVASASAKLDKLFKQQERSLLGIAESYKKVSAATRQWGRDAKTATSSATSNIDNVNKSLTTHNGLMTSAIVKIVRYRIAFGVWSAIAQSITEVVDKTIRLNQTIGNLRKVMNPVTTDFEFLSNAAFELSRRFGTTVLETADSMKVWAQQGKNMVEVAKLTESTLLGVNTANLSATESVEALTSATIAYGIEAENSSEIVDRWLAVQARFAVSAQDLANGTKAIAQAAKTSGVSIDELNGIIAAIGSVTRKTGREVANSFKTMLARLNRNVTATRFEEIGVAVRKSGTELRDVSDILTDLSFKWKDMEDAQKTSLAITVGGIRRYTDFIALMENFDTFTSATVASQRSLGEAQAANQEQLKTFSSRIQRVATAFDELGISIANSLVGDAISAFAGGVEDLALFLRDLSPEMVTVTKTMGLLGVATLTSLGVFKAFTASAALLGKVKLKLVSQVGAATAAIQLSRGAATASTGANFLLAESFRAVGSAAGVISIAVGAITALYIAYESLNTSTDQTIRNYKELENVRKGELSRASQEYDRQVDLSRQLKKLKAEKEQLVKLYSESATASEAENRAQAELAKKYKPVISAIAVLTRASTDVSKQVVLSNEAIDQAIAITNSKAAKGFTTLEGTVSSTSELAREQLNKVQKAIEATGKSFERLQSFSGNLLDLNDKEVIKTSTRGRNATEIKNFADETRDSILKALEDANIDESVRKSVENDLNSAFSKARASQNAEAYAEDINKVIERLKTNFNLTAADLTKTLEDAQKKIIGGLDVEIKPDAEFFPSTGAYNYLKALREVTEQSKRFEDTSESIRNQLALSGIAYNSINRNVSFYRSNIVKLYESIRDQEVKIALQEQELAYKELRGETAQNLLLEKDRLRVLKDERLTTSATYDEYLRSVKKIREESIKEQTSIIEKRRALVQTREVQEETARLLKVSREASKEVLNVEKEKLDVSLKTGGAYAKQYAEIARQTSLLNDQQDLLIERLIAVDGQKEAERQVTRSYQNQVAILQARSASVSETVSAEISHYQVLKQQEIARLSSAGALEDEDKIIQRILVLENKIAEARSKGANNENLVKVANQRAQLAIQTEIAAKSQALTNQLLKAQGASEEKVLKLRKEQLIQQYNINETKLAANGLDQKDTQAIARRKQLTLELAEIEKQLLAERIKSVETYRAQLSEVGTSISSVLSSNIGGIFQQQIDDYGEVLSLQQQIADAERDRAVAIKENNAEGLYDAEKSLEKLRDRQDELSSSTTRWVNSLTNAGEQIAKLANEKLSQQLVDSIFGLQFGDNSLADLAAKGIIIQPDSAKFQASQEQFASKIYGALQNGGIAVADYIRAAFGNASGVGGGGLAIGSADEISKTLSGAKTVGSEIEKGVNAATKGISDVAEIQAQKNADKIGIAIKSGVLLLANQLGTSLGGGGRGAGVGSSLGNFAGLALSTTNPLFAAGGAILGGLIGGFFDKSPEIENKPLFEDVSSSNPLPVSVEKFGDSERILHDISFSVEANFLDPSQLDPIAVRGLSERLKSEFEDLLKRENLWG